MIGRRSTAGLTLLCALLLSAFATQSASAQVGTPATNTTAVTCVKGGGNLDFSDAHCDLKVTAGTGEYGHVAIEAGKQTAADGTNAKTKSNTTEAEPGIMKTIFLGVNIEITCESVTNTGSWIENVEKEGKHTVEGTATGSFSKCKVVKPLNCAVKEPIVGIGKGRGVEGLKYGATEKEAMGVEVTQHEGKNFAEVTFEGEKCTFKGKTFPITGSAIGTGAVEPTKANKHAGATVIAETGNEMQTLKFSTSVLTVTGKGTATMAEGGGPIALTTVT